MRNIMLMGALKLIMYVHFYYSRNCYKCGLKFIKSDGCNYMTCACGAHMCYVCGQAVTNHGHFSSTKNENL